MLWTIDSRAGVGGGNSMSMPRKNGVTRPFWRNQNDVTEQHHVIWCEWLMQYFERTKYCFWSEKWVEAYCLRWASQFPHPFSLRHKSTLLVNLQSMDTFRLLPSVGDFPQTIQGISLRLVTNDMSCSDWSRKERQKKTPNIIIINIYCFSTHIHPHAIQYVASIHTLTHHDTLNAPIRQRFLPFRPPIGFDEMEDRSQQSKTHFAWDSDDKPQPPPNTSMHWQFTCIEETMLKRWWTDTHVTAWIKMHGKFDDIPIMAFMS